MYFVVKFARAYDRNVLEALAAAEFISDEEARLTEVKIGVSDLSTVQLAQELLDRAEDAERRQRGTGGTGAHMAASAD